ncbi:MAG: ABC transporter ATP-binding protein [Aerococcaceae bacterium]|nr:ABC transporter ATP-binding protein [Aerococcaceae bacterium]
MTQEYLLQMKKISKVYPNGVMANKDIELYLKKGEIHALMGENGAGKSTLMKILFGSEQPTSGEIILRGEKVVLNSPLDAIKKGIGMVHQHFMLDDNLSVMENIILGMEPKKGLTIDYKTAKTMVAQAAEKYGFNIKPDDIVSNLNVSQKQKVEILKALIRGAEILILDEPTAVLTPQETQELFVQLKNLRDEGHTIVFISHKLKEVKEICNNATVMRSGKFVGRYDLQDKSIQELSRLMVGRDVVSEVEKGRPNPTTKVLEVQGLQVLDNDLNVAVKGVDFAIRKGQIIGIAGVEGNGQREFIDCITGLNTEYLGTITLNGQQVEKKNTVRYRRELGMKHIPEDRLTYGVMKDGSIKDNIIANIYNDATYTNKGLLNDKQFESFAKGLIEKFQVKTDSPHTLVRMLSGGNMQKVVAAREMTGEFDLLVADQPTRGIDIGTATFIHDRLIELRDQGCAIILVSADINEVLTVSDSLVVFYDGEISAYFEDASQVTEEELGLYMLGINKMDKTQLEEVTK